MVQIAHFPPGTPTPKPANFKDNLDRAVGTARDMAHRYEESWNEPGFLDAIAQNLPNFEAKFKEVLLKAPLPRTIEEFQQLLLKAVVGGIAIGVATEALLKAGKLPPQ